MLRKRTGFTLVEMLVVISIIGVLATLVLVVGRTAMVAARNAAMQAEISLLDQGIAKYMSDHGDSIPPDFTNFDEVRSHLIKAYPQVGATAPQFISGFRKLHWGTAFSTSTDPQERMKLGIDPAEALVFWLGGYSNVQPGGDQPINATQGKLLGFPPGEKSRFIIQATDLANRTNWQQAGYFPFDETRLVDQDGDGFLEYLPKFSEVPYVYFSSNSYQTPANRSSTETNVFYVESRNASVAVPYRSDESYGQFTSGDRPSDFVEPKRYQIVCAGQDGLFSTLGLNSTIQRGFPFGTNFTPPDVDNLTNFSEKKLGDANPNN